MTPLANVIGFDDTPFAHAYRGDLLVVGVVCSRTRLDGILSASVRRDGANSAPHMLEMIRGSQFARHVWAVLPRHTSSSRDRSGPRALLLPS
jgi:uncharacterized protein